MSVISAAVNIHHLSFVFSLSIFLFQLSTQADSLHHWLDWYNSVRGLLPAVAARCTHLRGAGLARRPHGDEASV